MESEVKSHRDLSDQEFLSQFESCRLEPSLFTHEAHIRLAWIMLQKHQLNEAIEKIQQDILRFVDFVGAKDKYNVTLTVAAAHIISQLIQKSNHDSFESFIAQNEQLVIDFKSVIMRHYKTDIFRDEDAKIRFISPEIIPFTTEGK